MAGIVLYNNMVGIRRITTSAAEPRCALVKTTEFGCTLSRIEAT
jgi:hypothetical protein